MGTCPFANMYQLFIPAHAISVETGNDHHGVVLLNSTVPTRNAQPYLSIVD